MNFVTFYTFDPSALPNEVNSGEIVVDAKDYEPLSKKLERFTYLNIPLPLPSDTQYSGDDVDITDTPGFDIADYPLHEKAEELNELVNSHKKENYEKFSDENSQSINEKSVSDTTISEGGENN